MLIVALALPFLQLSLAATYTLQHRILLPSAPTEAKFNTYGTVSFPDDQGADTRFDTVRIERAGSSESGVGDQTEGGWYQVLLTGDGLGEGIMTSTRSVRAFLP